MRIVFLIQDCTTIGGTERVTCSLANEMARHGNDVSIVSVFGMACSCKFAIDDNVRFSVACDKAYNLQMSKAMRFKRVCQMARKLKNDQTLLDADVIIAQKFFAAILAVMAGLKHKLIIGEHYIYSMYPHPVIDLRDAIYRKAKAVVVLTEGCRNDFINHGVRNTFAIGNMATATTPPKQETQKQQLILAVGRLATEKGFDRLIDAFAKAKTSLDGWHLEICGEGDERPKLERLIAQHNLNDRVVLRGQVEDLTAEYQRASFAVVSSRYEGFSMAILEAAAMHLPVVSFDCPDGPRSLLAEGGGILVPDQDVDALASAIITMAQDERLRQRCADETDKIVEMFSPDKIYSKWMQIIERCL